MNVGEMILRVAAQMGQDEMEEDERGLAAAYLREAHDEMMRVYRPFIDVWVAVPEAEGLALEELGPLAGRVHWVFRNGMELSFSVEGGRLLVRGGQEQCLCVRCRYVPPVLAEDADVPPLPEGYHGALADFATFRMMANGGRARQQRGEMYYARYLQRKAALGADSEACRAGVIHKYGK